MPIGRWLIPLIRVIKGILSIVMFTITAIIFLAIFSGFAASADTNCVAWPMQADDIDAGIREKTSLQRQPAWIMFHCQPEAVSVLTPMTALLPLWLRKCGVSNGRKRKGIMEYISGNPGCIVSDIAWDEKIPRGTVRYHIGYLQSQGKILLIKAGKFLRIFPNFPMADKRKVAIQSLLKNKNNRKLIWAIFHGKGMTNQELSRHLCMDKSLTYRYIQKLVKNNVIASKETGMAKQYYIRDDFRPIIGELLTGYNGKAAKKHDGTE